MRRGPLAAGEKVQFTDRRSNKITDQLVPGGVTQTSHGIILHEQTVEGDACHRWLGVRRHASALG